MSELSDAQDRLRRLEELLSHHEHLLNQLNEVVLEVRSECDDLKTRFDDELSRLESRIDDQANSADPQEKPPHY